jgi:hypothetical protein
LSSPLPVARVAVDWRRLRFDSSARQRPPTSPAARPRSALVHASARPAAAAARAVLAFAPGATGARADAKRPRTAEGGAGALAKRPAGTQIGSSLAQLLQLKRLL